MKEERAQEGVQKSDTGELKNKGTSLETDSQRKMKEHGRVRDGVGWRNHEREGMFTEIDRQIDKQQTSNLGIC